MNIYAIKAIYLFEMSRTFRTISQSLLAPVISTILYFVVFGSVIGSKIETIEDLNTENLLCLDLLCYQF